MAQDTETSQVAEKPAASAPEPDIDSLLERIPGLDGVFAETPAAQEPGKPEQPKQQEAPKPEPGAPEAAGEFEIPEGLKPEEEKPPEEPKKEELSDKVQKRIDELTAKRKTAEERATALETELSDLKSRLSAPPPVAPTPASPLADVETEKDLAAKVNHILEAKSWCIQHLDGGEVEDGKGGRQWVDGATVKSILANAEMMISKHVPEHEKFLKNRAVFDVEAKRNYPALFKEGTEPYNVRMQWLTLLPECRRYPDINVIIGDAILGQSIRLQRQKTNGKLPPGNQPLATPAPAASPRVPQSRALSGEALQAAFAADPSRALDSFVDQLIDGAAAQRARS